MTQTQNNMQRDGQKKPLEEFETNVVGRVTSRRTLLQRTLIGGVAAMASFSLLSACGDDDEGDENDDGGAAGDPTDPPADEPTATEDSSDPGDDPTATSEGEAPSENTETPDDGMAAQAGGTLQYIILRDPTTFDPHITDGATSYAFQGNVYDKLVDYDEAGAIGPALAESWEINDDLTYRFTLRQGVIFHDGSELTAEDVIYSLDRMLDDATNATLQPQLSTIDSYEAVDDYSVDVTLSEPYAPFLSVLAHWTAAIISKEFSEGDVDYTTTMNGTGPFKQDEFETDVRYVMTKHTDYWQPDMPYLDALELRAIRDDSARIAAIQSGDAGLITYTPWQVIQELSDDDGFEVFVSFSLFNNLRLNHNSAPFDDPRVRQAISYAIDRDAVHGIAFGGQGRSITGGLIPPDSQWHNADLEGYYTYDPDRALALLAEAGYDDPSAIDINFRSSSSAVHFDSAEVVAQQLRDLGLNVELESQDSATLIERRSSGDYQLMFDGLSPHWEDPDFYSVLFQTGASAHAAGVNFSNEQLDDLFQQGRSTLEFEARKEIYRQVEELILQELPMIFLFFRPQAESIDSSINGYAEIPNLGARPESYMERVWIEQGS